MSGTNLSADTLFHFTDRLENIISILENGFYPRYCMEQINEKEIAIPIVCFCDIPLSQIKNHINNYGKYGIGLKKEWGIENGLNPVFYANFHVNQESFVVKNIKNISKYLVEASAQKILSPWIEFNKKVDVDKLLLLPENYLDSLDLNSHYELCENLEEFINSLPKIVESDEIKTNYSNFYLIYNIKPYEGQKWDKDNFEFNGEYTRFYDEREWRYIPDMDISTFCKLGYLEKEKFKENSNKDEKNKEISELYKLNFKAKDIKYIVVESDEDILNLCNAIDRIMGEKYSQNDIKRLKTRIISSEQILNDF